MDDNDPLTPARRRARALGAVITGAGMWAMAAGAAVITLWPQAPEWLSEALVAAVVVALALALVLFARAGAFRFGRKIPAPALREFAQWDRWQSCLFLFPALLTGLAFIALGRVRAWQGGDHAWTNLIWPMAIPLYVVFVAQRFLPEKSPPRGLVRNPIGDAFSDELSLEHARLAFRAGFFGMALGLAATLVIGLVAPERTLEAVLGCVWLGFVACCVRFGLLQRAADKEA